MKTFTKWSGCIITACFLLLMNFSASGSEVYGKHGASYVHKQNKIKTSPTLSLGEAILLAVRYHPNVISTQLTAVLQKFNTSVQTWEFYPHYSFLASETVGRVLIAGQPPINMPPNFNLQPGVSLLTPLGTTASLNLINQAGKHYNPGLSIQLMQPLMRGFGRAVVEAALDNARDSEVVSRLNIEG